MKKNLGKVFGCQILINPLLERTKIAARDEFDEWKFEQCIDNLAKLLQNVPDCVATRGLAVSLAYRQLFGSFHRILTAGDIEVPASFEILNQLEDRISTQKRKYGFFARVFMTKFPSLSNKTEFFKRVTPDMLLENYRDTQPTDLLRYRSLRLAQINDEGEILPYQDFLSYIGVYTYSPADDVFVKFHEDGQMISKRKGRGGDYLTHPNEYKLPYKHPGAVRSMFEKKRRREDIRGLRRMIYRMKNKVLSEVEKEDLERAKECVDRLREINGKELLKSVKQGRKRRS